jgi:hypothetical protein
MNQRLYFLLPDREHAFKVITELREQDVVSRQMHTLAGKGLSAEGLPDSSHHLRNNLAGRIEFWGWRLNLTLFFLAAGTLVTMILLQAGLWLLLPLGAMIVTFVLGVRFTRIPNVHLDAFRDALRHGEILLMVDTPQGRVDEVEHSVQRRHPEAVAAGSSWNMPVLGT